MNPTTEIVAYARTTIKFYAKKLIGKCGITKADLEDIEQEMMLDVLQRMPKHDQRWSYKTFITHIVKNKSHHILRSRHTGKESLFRSALSMDAPCKTNGDGGDNVLTFHDVVSNESLDWGNGTSSSDPRHLNIDLAEVISKLSEIQKQCCQALMNHEPITKIAEDHDMPRSTFYKHVILPIREAFVEAGLEEYLD